MRLVPFVIAQKAKAIVKCSLNAGSRFSYLQCNSIGIYKMRDFALLIPKYFVIIDVILYPKYLIIQYNLKVLVIKL